MRTSMSCRQIADKFDLRAWLLYLRARTFGFAYVVFKTTYVDEGKPLRAATFLFTERAFSLCWIRKILVLDRGAHATTGERYYYGRTGVLHAERATPHGGNRDMSTPAMIFSTFGLYRILIYRIFAIGPWSLEDSKLLPSYTQPSILWHT